MDTTIPAGCEGDKIFLGHCLDEAHLHLVGYAQVLFSIFAYGGTKGRTPNHNSSNA